MLALLTDVSQVFLTGQDVSGFVRNYTYHLIM